MKTSYTENNAFQSPNNHKWVFKTEVIINFLNSLKEEDYPIQIKDTKTSFSKVDLEEMLKANKVNLEKWLATPQFKDSVIVSNKFKAINEYFKSKPENKQD